MTRHTLAHISILLLCASVTPAAAQTVDLNQLLKPQPAPTAPAQNLQARFQKAMTLQRSGKLDAALAEFRAINKEQPTNVPVILNMGITYAMKGDLKSSEAVFQEALILDPKNPLALSQLARLSLARQDAPEALRYAKVLALANPKVFEAQFLLGTAYLANKNFAAGTKALQAALKIKNNDKMVIQNLAFAYMSLKEWAKSRSYAERLVKLDPKSSNPRMMAAFLAEKAGDKAGAIVHYEAASRIEAASIPALTELARLYGQTRNQAKSAEVMKRLLGKDKSNYRANLALGQMQYNKGNLPAAEGYLVRAVTTQPKSVEANILLALTRARLRKLEPALKNASVALGAAPKDRNVLSVYTYILENSGNYDKAIQFYRKWIGYYPDDIAPHLKIAMICVVQQKKQEALAEYEAALKKQPKNYDLIMEYAGTQMSYQQYDKAYLLYENALAIKPKSADTMISAAVCLQKLNKLDDAKKMLENALKNEPKSVRAYMALAQLYQDQKLPEQALAEYNKILVFDPKNVQALQALAGLSESQKNYDVAIEAYRKLAQIEPANTGYCIAITRAYDAWGKLDEAIAEARKLVETDPKSADYRNNLASLLEKKGDNDGALKEYAEIAKIAPDFRAYALEKSGAIRQKQGKDDDAMADYKKAIETKPDFVRALNALSKLCETLKRQDDFELFLKTVVISGKENAPFAYYYKTMNTNKKTDEAIKTLEEALAKQPDNIQLNSTLANAYEDANQKDKAIDRLKTMLAKNPTDADANKRLGMLYISVNKFQEAANSLAKASKTLVADKDLLLNLASTYEKLEDRPKALAACKEFLKLVSANEKPGDRDKALSACKDYLKIDPANQDIRAKLWALENPTPTDGGATAAPNPAPTSIVPAEEPSVSQPPSAALKVETKTEQ